MKKSLITILVVAAIASAFYLNQPQETETTETPTENTEETTQPEVETYDIEGQLEDVTGNQATGQAKARFVYDSYELLATFQDLPDPEGTDFYEGWVVRKGDNFNVISTGKAIKKDGNYENIFRSNQDYSDHTFYVLTLEPDDGDPAPAEHILEGTMK